MLKTRASVEYQKVNSVRSQRIDGAVIDSSVEAQAFSLGRSRTTAYQEPGWERRIQDGDNATTYLAAVESSIKNTPCDLYRANYGFFDPNVFVSSITGGLYRVDVASLAGPSQLQDADSQALSSYVREIRKAQRHLQGLVVLGELAETLRMIRRPGMALRLKLDDIIKRQARVSRRNRVLPPERRRKVLANSWLEYSFGVMPLVSDISGAAHAASEIVERIVPPHRYVVGRGGNVTNDIIDGPLDSYGSFGTLRYQVTINRHADVTYRGVVQNHVDATGARAIPAIVGVSWSDVVPAIWELIPYSFLVDYFTNIGDVLSALSLNTTDIAWTARTERLESTAEAFGFTCAVPPPKLITQRLDPGSMSTSNKSVLRDTYTGSLIPSFRWQLPGFSSLKWLNIAALAHARWR